MGERTQAETNKLHIQAAREICSRALDAIAESRFRAAIRYLLRAALDLFDVMEGK